ncbi:MAG TPA: HAMP domain-containing sensor histidine kinase, partial [Candidatus Limnocylindrales bacterium]|nr:HAMP domain-containing sensor histidine kinase [Candidatus Limnocylindrales bacterium]
EVRGVINQVRREVVQSDVTVQLLATDGTIVELGAVDPSPSQPIVIPAGTRIGDTLTGTAPFSDGATHDYAALVLRGPGAAGSRAVLLSTVDRAGAMAVRDVGRSLPIVILATLAVGAPLALLLSRSVARPLAAVRQRAGELADPTRPLGPPLAETGPTEVRDLTGRVNQVAAELARSRAREGELLADLRHDLRTPLTVIAGYAAALADGTATGPAAEQAAAAIGEEAARLERLVGQLGTIDRARTGADALHLEWIDVDEVLAATAQRFAARAVAAGVTLVGPAPAGESSVEAAGLLIAADRVALDRILGNLLENALAVVDAGGTIRLEAQPVKSAAEWSAGAAGSSTGAGGVERPGIAFTVSDDGPGFPPGGVERAFERFYRGDPSRSGSGAGLGLAIVQELARAHGGFAVAENLAPRGARVSVVLPVEPRAAATDAMALDATQSDAGSAAGQIAVNEWATERPPSD